MDAYDRRQFGTARHSAARKGIQDACPDCGAAVQPWSTTEPLTWWCPECRTELTDEQIVRLKGSARG